MMHRLPCLLASTLLLSTGVGAQQLRYPTPPRAQVADTYFGRVVADPYRPLENPDAAPTRTWIEAENGLTLSYLGRLGLRDSIQRRLTTLWNYPKVRVPVREAGQLWFRRNSGLQKQFVLYRKASPAAPAVVVLDPNLLSADGSIAVDQWSVSPDGRLLGYTTASGGSDVRDIHLRDLATGRDLAEIVPRVKFSDIAWTRDSKGFYFSRFDGSREHADLHDPSTHDRLYYHRIGGADRRIFERGDDSTAWLGGVVSDDGRWLYVSSASGAVTNQLAIADLGHPARPDIGAPLVSVTTAEDAINRPLGVVGDTLYLYTNWEAPRGRIVALTIGDTARSHWRTVVAEGPEVMDETLLVGRRLVASYLVDVQSRLRLFDLTGTPRGEVPLPDAGSVAGLSGRNAGSDFYFAFSSYLQPTTVYRYDLATARLSPFELARSPFDAEPYETRASFYHSKDGTRVPIFITARKGIALDGSHPTLLYGYGGFDISITPYFSPSVATWLELGGVYAVANLRGGGEYGEAWHQAGMRDKKQNVFDDFIAGAEFLIHEGYTSPRNLAIQGASNGGLLVGAAMTQRPDLFGVALPEVGVMDMLRYQHFTGGQLWAAEYGSSADSGAVGYLLGYSPLHHLRPSVCYPATMVSTADHDDRVVPGHSFKFAAGLQAAQGCARPVLLRVETAGSHGYRPTDRVIAEIADELAFALANMGGDRP